MAGSRKREIRRGSIVTTSLILVVIAALGLRLYGLRLQVENARLERDRYQVDVEAVEQKNAALRSDIEEGPTTEKMVEIAMRDLGMVLESDYVFYPGG